MIAKELTPNQRRVFNTMRICPVCGKEILDFDDMKMFRLRHRRRVYYNFIHKRCEYGEERIIQSISRQCTQDG